MRQDDAADAVEQGINIRPAHQFALLLHQTQLKQLGFDRDVISVGFHARRLPPLAPQVPQATRL